jgi:hypothetical protein
VMKFVNQPRWNFFAGICLPVSNVPGPGAANRRNATSSFEVTRTRAGDG